MQEIETILKNSKTIAMIGVSSLKEKEDRTNLKRKPSTIVMKYMQEFGYKVIPVNPFAVGEIIHGEKVVAKLSDINEKIDIVNVFRPSKETPGIAEDAVKIGAKVLWGQIGVVNYEAARLAEKAGLKVVMNRCPKIELFRPFWKPRLDLKL